LNLLPRNCSARLTTVKLLLGLALGNSEGIDEGSSERIEEGRSLNGMEIEIGRSDAESGGKLMGTELGGLVGAELAGEPEKLVGAADPLRLEGALEMGMLETGALLVGALLKTLLGAAEEIGPELGKVWSTGVAVRVMDSHSFMRPSPPLKRLPLQTWMVTEAPSTVKLNEPATEKTPK